MRRVGWRGDGEAGGGGSSCDRFFSPLRSDGSVGRRCGGAFSRSGGRLEEDTGLPEGESVRRRKTWPDFIFPPVTKATANNHRKAVMMKLMNDQ